jgi:hypothetical protein
MDSTLSPVVSKTKRFQSTNSSNRRENYWESEHSHKKKLNRLLEKHAEYNPRIDCPSLLSMNESSPLYLPWISQNQFVRWKNLSGVVSLNLINSKMLDCSDFFLSKIMKKQFEERRMGNDNWITKILEKTKRKDQRCWWSLWIRWDLLLSPSSFNFASQKNYHSYEPQLTPDIDTQTDERSSGYPNRFRRSSHDSWLIWTLWSILSTFERPGSWRICYTFLPQGWP